MTPEKREQFIRALHLRTRSTMMPFNIYQRDYKPGGYDSHNLDRDYKLYDNIRKETVRGYIFIAKLVDEIITELGL